MPLHLCINTNTNSLTYKKYRHIDEYISRAYTLKMMLKPLITLVPTCAHTCAHMHTHEPRGVYIACTWQCSITPAMSSATSAHGKENISYCMELSSYTLWLVLHLPKISLKYNDFLDASITNFLSKFLVKTIHKPTLKYKFIHMGIENLIKEFRIL